MLELDVGNTRLKWRLLDDQGQSLLGGALLGGASALEALAKRVSPARVRISCVRNQQYRETLASMIGELWGVVPEFAIAQASQAGLTNAYVDVGRLGVDRWLAMLAGKQLSDTSFCVVDAGSALTMDFVDSMGLHLGGYIVPGLTLQKKSLLENTAIQMPDLPVGGALCPGKSTESAIHNGVVGMAVAWIAQECRVHIKEGCLFLTGGDAQVLAAHLQNESISCSLVPELVMDGLRVALP